MRTSAQIALASAAVTLAVGLGCSSKLSSGYDSIPDIASGGHATIDPETDAGGDEADASSQTGCELFLADAAPPDAAPYQPDAAFTPSPCQPTGPYNIVIDSSGDCSGFFSSGTSSIKFDDPPQAPYPYPSCMPAQQVFTADVCTVYIPKNTVCDTPAGPLTFQSCGYFSCSMTGDNCVYFAEGSVDLGGGKSCFLHQTVRFTR